MVGFCCFCLFRVYFVESWVFVVWVGLCAISLVCVFVVGGFVFSGWNVVWVGGCFGVWLFVCFLVLRFGVGGVFWGFKLFRMSWVGLLFWFGWVDGGF